MKQLTLILTLLIFVSCNNAAPEDNVLTETKTTKPSPESELQYISDDGRIGIGYLKRGGMEYIVSINRYYGGVKIVNVTLDSLKAEQIKKELNK